MDRNHIHPIFKKKSMCNIKEYKSRFQENFKITFQLPKHKKHIKRLRDMSLRSWMKTFVNLYQN